MQALTVSLDFRDGAEPSITITATHHGTFESEAAMAVIKKMTNRGVEIDESGQTSDTAKGVLNRSITLIAKP